MFGSPLYRGKEAQRQRKKNHRILKGRGGRIVDIKNKERFRGSIGERFYGDSKPFGYRQARDDERNT